MGESDATAKSLLRFTPFSSLVNSSFWFKFADLKLNDDMLKEVTRHLWTYYSHVERTGGLSIDCTSFNTEADNYPMRSVGHGYHTNTNTVEQFKNLNKNELLAKYGEELLELMKNGDAVDDPSKLVFFTLLTFADLKKYTFHYWFAFPAALDFLYYQYESPKNLGTYLEHDQIRKLSELHGILPESQKGFFCFKLCNSELEVFPIKQFITDPSASDNVFIAFLDPTTLQDLPGWSLRNLLSLFQIKCPGVFEKPLRVVSIRGESAQWNLRSVVFTINLSEKTENADKVDKFVGWEKNSKGKLSPRLVNLSDDMDPSKLSSRTVDLNLKLVKWRLQPDLDLDILKSTSCLLLGAGTLGCSVARVLTGWGIERITFVDNGVVSYSNPARQSLYTFEDSCKSRKKAQTAAAALKLIHPGLTVEGENLHIPTPGYSEYDINHVRRLQELVSSHDAVFLLTDSRESRWLPTLLCAAKKKIAITVALGYDSYLVMRHGIESKNSEPKLGCYFCNDVVAPGNSQADRTLDQQCTVTRPGLSGIAASYGVELLIALLQHPEKGLVNSDGVSCLGKIPHSIRGFISDYEHMYPSTRAFENCIACSTIVIEKYLEDGEEFLKTVFSNVKYLEEVTKLSQYQIVEGDMDFPESDDEE